MGKNIKSCLTFLFLVNRVATVEAVLLFIEQDSHLDWLLVTTLISRKLRSGFWVVLRFWGVKNILRDGESVQTSGVLWDFCVNALHESRQFFFWGYQFAPA
jgi:hypothetical protein